MSRIMTIRPSVTPGRWPLAVALLTAFLSACTQTRVASHRLLATGIERHESVAIVLDSYQDCDAKGQCKSPASHESAEQTFAGCLGRGMLAFKTDLRIMPASDFRRTAFPASSEKTGPQPADTLAAQIRDIDLAQRLAALNLRYVIVLKTRTTTGSAKFAAEINDISMVGSEWPRTSSLTAEVLDVRSARHAGTLTAHSFGTAGFRIPVFVVIPLPLPIPYSSPTESEACHSLGRSVAEFIANPKQERGSANDGKDPK